MKRVALVVLALAGAASAGSRAEARTVDYDQLESQLETMASDLQTEPATALPDPASYDLVLENAENADHAVRFLAIMCSGHDVENPASQVIRRILTGVDRDQALTPVESGASVLLTVDEASTLMRCFYRSDVDAQCIARATIRATASYAGADGAPRQRPLSVRIERTLDSDGFCGGIAQGVGFVTREAAITIANDLTRAVEQDSADPSPAAPAAQSGSAEPAPES